MSQKVDNNSRRRKSTADKYQLKTVCMDYSYARIGLTTTKPYTGWGLYIIIIIIINCSKA